MGGRGPIMLSSSGGLQRAKKQANLRLGSVRRATAQADCREIGKHFHGDGFCVGHVQESAAKNETALQGVRGSRATFGADFRDVENRRAPTMLPKSNRWWCGKKAFSSFLGKRSLRSGMPTPERYSATRHWHSFCRTLSTACERRFELRTGAVKYALDRYSRL